ncbi:hypothetical protein N2152v2_003074 [Parachlorella kessleri]
MGFAKTHVLPDDDIKQVLAAPAGEDAFTKTKICITMGPSLNDVDLLSSLLEAGTTCARIDLTWQNLDQHRKSLQLLAEAMKRTRRLCAVMLDVLGRDVLVRRKYEVDANGWPVFPEQITVKEGQQVTLTADPDAKCTQTVFPLTYTQLPEMVSPGDSICVARYLATGADKGSLFLEVEETLGQEVYCVAKNSAVLDGLLTVFHQASERSTEGLSNLQNTMPVLDEWDKHAITTLAREFEVDFVTLAYCRSRQDVEDARDFLSSIGKEGIKVVAKCETRVSLLNFQSISRAADAIIIARGNLGLDVAPEKMAMVQKAMISTCAGLGKPSLVARVVDSMAVSPRPTRAEATDVANAVLDGADGIVLGAETFRGQYPLETVRTVAAICREAERVFDHNNHYEHLVTETLKGQLEADRAADDGYCPELPRSVVRRSSSSGAIKKLGYSSSEEELSPQLLLLGRGSPTTGPYGAGLMANGSTASIAGMSGAAGTAGASRTWKLESIASGAVKAAGAVRAALIVCVTHTGRTASMVARYRPPMPILTLVVPYLKNEGLKWALEGRSVARQAQLTSGLLPVLAAPTPSVGESLLEEAIALASAKGLVKAHDHVVVVSLTASREPMVKVVSVSEAGNSIMPIRPASLLNLVRAKNSRQEDNGTAHGKESPRSPSLPNRCSTIVGNRADMLVPLREEEEVANGSCH